MEAKSKQELKLHCFFCAERLHPQADGRWVCHGCGAFFKPQWDPEGCLLGLAVQGCGTGDCCQEEVGG